MDPWAWRASSRPRSITAGTLSHCANASCSRREAQPCAGHCRCAAMGVRGPLCGRRDDLMRLWAHRYQLMPCRRLSPIATAGARKGALLRMRTDSGAEGFADLHPWPELGDLPLETQLAMLARGETTAQSQ